MAQKIWTEYFQIGNASAEEAIPGAIIHMQTRDGNDEALTGAVNMQWDDNAGLFLPTDKDNPLEARVRHLEALVGALNATKETNPDAASATLLALLRGLMATGATESTLGSVKTAAEALAGTVDSGVLKTTLTGSDVNPVNVRDTDLLELVRTHENLVVAAGASVVASTSTFQARQVGCALLVKGDSNVTVSVKIRWRLAGATMGVRGEKTLIDNIPTLNLRLASEEVVRLITPEWNWNITNHSSEEATFDVYVILYR